MSRKKEKHSSHSKSLRGSSSLKLFIILHSVSIQVQSRSSATKTILTRLLTLGRLLPTSAESG